MAKKDTRQQVIIEWDERGYQPQRQPNAPKVKPQPPKGGSGVPNRPDKTHSDGDGAAGSS